MIDHVIHDRYIVESWKTKAITIPNTYHAHHMQLVVELKHSETKQVWQKLQTICNVLVIYISDKKPVVFQCILQFTPLTCPMPQKFYRNCLCTCLTLNVLVHKLLITLLHPC